MDRARGLGDRARETCRRHRRAALLGFDFPLGVPQAYAELAGIDNFASWLRQLDPGDELFAVADELAEVSVARPFFRAGVGRHRPSICDLAVRRRPS